MNDIAIVNGEEEGTQIVTFQANSSKLTKEQAVESMGDRKERFVVQSLEKKDPPKDSGKSSLFDGR